MSASKGMYLLSMTRLQTDLQRKVVGHPSVCPEPVDMIAKGHSMSTMSEVDMPRVDQGDRGDRGDRDLGDLLQKIVELESQVAHLEEAVTSRQQIGFITGVLAERFGLNPDEAWAVMVRVSSHMNVKVHEIARVLHAGYFGEVAQEDLDLAARLNEHLPPRGRIELIDPLDEHPSVPTTHLSPALPPS
jgi:ANTAR domain